MGFAVSFAPLHLQAGSDRACRFPPELATIPGIRSSAEEESTSETQASEGPIARIGKGITPPKVVFSSDPEFSELARRAKYQGTVLLWVVIGPEGRPRDIRVQRSLGMGLDEKAIEAVRQWKFEPSMKDGHPVAVQVNVEVSFRLY